MADQERQRQEKSKSTPSTTKAQTGQINFDFKDVKPNLGNSGDDKKNKNKNKNKGGSK